MFTFPTEHCGAKHGLVQFVDVLQLKLENATAGLSFRVSEVHPST